MPRIVETIVTTQNAAGEVHIAPLGLIEDGEGWIIAPFRPSRTLDNLRANPFAVASHTDDVRVFAGCLTGRRDWPLKPASKVKGKYLDERAHALGAGRRPRDRGRAAAALSLPHRAHGSHAPWPGFNRAQVAVLELAVLTTRLHMLPPPRSRANSSISRSRSRRPPVRASRRPGAG